MLISILFAFLGPIEHESGTVLRSLKSLEVRQLIWTNCVEAQEISRLHNLSHLCTNTHTKKRSRGGTADKTHGVPLEASAETGEHFGWF